LTTAGPSFSRGVAPGYFRSSLQDAEERLFPQSLAPWRLWLARKARKTFLHEHWRRPTSPDHRAATQYFMRDIDAHNGLDAVRTGACYEVPDKWNSDMHPTVAKASVLD